MNSDSSDNSRESTHLDDDSNGSNADGNSVFGSAKRYFNLQKCSTKSFLSPITEISLGLEDTNLSATPVKTSGSLLTKIKSFSQALNEHEDDNDDKDGDDADDEDADAASSLLSNNFTINSAGRSPSTRLAEQRLRGAQRRQNIAPIRISYDDDKASTCDNDGSSGGGVLLSTNEELSFYSGNSPQSSPRPCSISPCMDIGLLSPETSPNNKFSTILIHHDGEVETHTSRTETAPQRQLQQPQLARLMPLDDHDINSMDSGYGGNLSSHSNKSVFRFPFPATTTRRKTPSKVVTATMTSGSAEKTNTFKVYNSLSSGSVESIDDDYMDLDYMDPMDEDAQLPNDLCSLISGDIKTMQRMTPEVKARPLARRCLSLQDSPLASKVRNNLFDQQRTPDRLKVADENALSTTPYSSRMGDAGKCFKRPEPPGVSPVQIKRQKYDNLSPRANQENMLAGSPISSMAVVKRPTLKKSISMNDAHIMTALARSSTEPDLIGDFSKPFCLPLIDGRHQDLKSISCDTLAGLISGEFDAQVGSFQIIDCRYPYEFEGGHIRGAKNLYTHEDIIDELVKNKTEPTTMTVDSTMFTAKRNILIFHCEFSSERGPKLSRFLRNNDRQRNEHAYPALAYPEIYLLHGGYKEFYETHSDLCDPIAYRPMLDADYTEAYRHFRAKSKSWNGDSAKPNRLVKSRSRLVL